MALQEVLMDARHSKWFWRLLTLLDEDDNVIGQVVMNIYFPDCINWEKAKELGIRGYT